MKKFLIIVCGILFIPLVIILVILGVFFYEPTVFIKESNIKWALDKTKILDSWSWKKMEITHEWKKWNDRHLTGDIRDFCFHLKKENEVKACFPVISWNFDLIFSFTESFRTKTYSPFRLHSSEFSATIADTQDKEKSPPPDIFGYWSMLWSGAVPDVDVKFDSMAITSSGKTTKLDFELKKLDKKLTASAMKFHLSADPEGFELKAPPAIEIPEKVEAIGPFFVRHLKLTGKVKEKEIPLLLTGALEEAVFEVKANLELPLKEDLSSLELRRHFLSTVSGEMRLPDFRKAYYNHAPKTFRELPAPLNVMNGTIVVKFKIKKGPESLVTFSSDTNIDLASSKEALNLTVSAGGDLPVDTFKPETINIGLAFHKVKLELPKLSKKAPPPQFLPDGRFKKGPYRPPEENKGKMDIDLHLAALDNKSLHIVTNLLDEPLRMNFDLFIADGKVTKGHVTILPLKTKIFRRPIHLKSLTITFDAPKEPVIVAEIQFPLPEYKITLELEGPVSRPRYAFKSDPPLPQSDIFAVLLFGRPLSDLGSEDKTAAQKTNEILSQGILSLSVLYFLAGSPVEYVGFDPGSQNATAQFGLSSKTSLRVGGGKEGMNAGGLRHSLGKGWYIDTTVQDNKNSASNKRSDYGVLLERVIAY